MHLGTGHLVFAAVLLRWEMKTTSKCVQNWKSCRGKWQVAVADPLSDTSITTAEAIKTETTGKSL